MARSQRRWLNDDAAWTDEVFRRIGKEYDVETGWAAQGWYQDVELQGDMQRRLDRVEASLSRIVGDGHCADAYDHPLVDHLYTITRLYGPEPDEDGGVSDPYYAQHPDLADTYDTIVLDENVVYDMFLCRGRAHGDASIPAPDLYDEVMDDLPAPREQDHPAHVGFALLDTLLDIHDREDMDIYFPDRVRPDILRTYGAGVTAEIYDCLEALGEPLALDPAPRTTEPDITEMGEDTIIAEEAEELDALIITNDGDFLDIAEHLDITALPPDLALMEVAAQESGF